MSDEVKVPSDGDKVRMNLWMSRQMFDFLQYVSSRDGRTMSDIVRESLRDYIVKDKQIMGAVDANHSSGRLLVE